MEALYRFIVKYHKNHKLYHNQYHFSRNYDITIDFFSKVCYNGTIPYEGGVSMERTRQGMLKICDEYASIIMEANRRRVSVYDAAGADKLKELQRQCTAYINRERILVNDQDSEGYHLALIVHSAVSAVLDTHPYGD